MVFKNKFYKKYKVDKVRNLSLDEIAYLSQVPIEKIRDYYLSILGETMFDIDDAMEKVYKFVMKGS
jgi:hypothetical protein